MNSEEWEAGIYFRDMYTTIISSQDLSSEATGAARGLTVAVREVEKWT